MKTIIEKNNGYAVTEWVEKPKQLNQVPIDGSEYTILYEGWKQELASQPSVPIHPDHTQWAKENLYQPVEDDRIETFECRGLIIKQGLGKRNICKKCGTEYKALNLSRQCLKQYAIPQYKQPVEVGRHLVNQGNYTPALPVEKEGAREIIASFLFRNFSTDLEPIEDMVSARLMADSLICQLPTTPPSEDWVSVERVMKMSLGISEHQASEFVKYLSRNFTLNRKKKD